VPVPSGDHRPGEDRTGECSEPSVMPRQVELRMMDFRPGCRDLADGMRQAAAGDLQSAV
jgi:hypothetical protein